MYDYLELCRCKLAIIEFRIQDEYPCLLDMSISEAMRESVYLDRVSAPVSALFERQPECAACEHRFHCNGGCRAAALMENNCADYFGIDSWTFRYLRGVMKKISEAALRNHLLKLKNSDFAPFARRRRRDCKALETCRKYWC